ncbi:RagB/SusD family nutrient uptake outer membrane protein [Myroides pelagicus]|uniref:RagB/SusD family nutrient uptake outer membrane protein n=1 Tax=Myroides pelagicus TaxID=270914 RepID=A0A7K1GK54_9FLAO|nr:RagB/SusD family nutrient uptake outer membrane protein [Myroides pelagicus]MTH29241.1 RagB/SusD family nutrient uptake outer membrane protein [Myroides pelagicus]
MKRNKFILIALAALTLGSCSSDFLDKEPLSDVTGDNFFQKESDLQLYANSFYRMFPATSIYNGDNTPANIVQNILSEEIRGTRTVPTTGGGWSWANLRNINYFLENHERVPVESAVKHYGGVAKFFRAYFYFDKLKRFGDVPWYDYVIDPSDTASLEKARDPRKMVVDNILKDLDQAIAGLNTSKKTYTITKWTALALKTRVALYEGTYMKYRGIPGYEPYLTQAYTSAEILMNESGYKVFSTGNPSTDYRDLFASHKAIGDEIILAREYDDALNVKHNVNYYTVTSSYGRPSMPKELVDSYLMQDGSRFTDLPNHKTMMFGEETQNRDLRLSQTIRTPGYTRLGSDKTLAPDLSAAVTGYQLIKYVTEQKYDSNSSSIVDLPLFRFAEVLLNYAEAKAELGILTQEDLDKSVNKLRERVAMPVMDLAGANANADAFLAKQYANVTGANKGILLELRRERRIELFMEDFRWDDIVRWKAGQALTLPIEGMYFPGAGQYDLDNDGKIDINLYEGQRPNPTEKGVFYIKLGSEIYLNQNNRVDPHPTFANRTFDENKDYLYPIPTQELQLNNNLEQNPRW